MYGQSAFSKFAKWISYMAGRPVVFIAAVTIILLWAIVGPVFSFSDTWQLVVNTGTTIVTFLMVFLIQNTLNRDSAALQLKLDELIRSTQGAHNMLLDLEELSETDLERIRGRYEELAREARQRMTQGLQDIDSPDVEPEARKSRSPRDA